MIVECDVCPWIGDFNDLAEHQDEMDEEDEPVLLCPECTSSMLSFIEEDQGHMTRRYEICPRCQNKKIVGTMCFRCLHKVHLESLERKKKK